MKKLSIVVPIFNELDNLDQLVSEVESAVSKLSIQDWEAILVDDGSTDGTKDHLAKLVEQKKPFRSLHFSSNQGQTAAMDAGIRNADGKIIVFMDADLQNDPKDIGKLLEKLDEGVDCVCGVRVKRRDNALRLLSSKIANGVRNWLSQETITDTGCSLKAFRRECFEGMQLFEGMHRFLPTLVKMRGFRVIEVPVNHRPRFAGDSKYGVWNRVFKSFKDLLAVRWMKARILKYHICEAHAHESLGGDNPPKKDLQVA